MANVTGLLTCSMLLLFVLNFVPGVHLSLVWQAIAAVCLGITNLLVWRRMQIEPMPFRKAAKDVALGLLLLAALAVFDTSIGFASGQRTVWAAFIHSGAFGGIVDAFLTTCGLFIGVPTLARSVYLYHHGRGSKEPTMWPLRTESAKNRRPNT
jgi:hypothetical protein